MDAVLIKKIKLHDIDVNSFYKNFLSEQGPILITDIFEQFPSLENWNHQYLVDKVGNKTIEVKISEDGIFTLNPETGKPYFAPTTMSIREYIKAIGQKNQKQKAYGMQIPILTELPELKDELKIIDYIPDKYVEFVNIWFGPGGNTTALHFDHYNNFFMQLFGEKKMWLYSPACFYDLYPNSWRSRASHVSPVDVANPDYIKYPNALRAKGIELTILPGNILFLPAYWWHQVYGINPNISINIFCQASLRQKFALAHFHSCFNSMFTMFEDKLLSIKRFFGMISN